MMPGNKYLFIGLALIIFGVFIFLGYSYYSLYKPLQETVSIGNSIANGTRIKVQNLPHIDMNTYQSLTQTTASEVAKFTTTKKEYQTTETERFFYQKVIESLKPKPIPKLGTLIFEGGITWQRETYKAFPPREPLYPGETKQYEDSVSQSKQYYQDISMNLYEIIKQCPDSSYRSLYHETFDLITQMQKEEEVFYDKYDVGGKTDLVLGFGNDIHYRGTMQYPSIILLDEKKSGYIHCLRYSYFYKVDGKYIMEFGDGRGLIEMPSNEPILSGAKLVEIGAPAVPAVLNILEDRRPIIAVDEDKIPSRFYRYQDAAVEILQRMFPKVQRPFPIEIHEDEYFSEYLEKQTPQERQNTINSIKKWVEETLTNPPKQEEPLQETK